MRKLKDALRLKFEGGLSHLQIATALGLSKGVVTKYVGLAVAAGLDAALLAALDEAGLERRLLASPRLSDFARAAALLWKAQQPFQGDQHRVVVTLLQVGDIEGDEARVGAPVLAEHRADGRCESGNVGHHDHDVARLQRLQWLQWFAF